jgi:hypothetical protein
MIGRGAFGRSTAIWDCREQVRKLLPGCERPPCDDVDARPKGLARFAASSAVIEYVRCSRCDLRTSSKDCRVELIACQ